MGDLNKSLTFPELKENLPGISEMLEMFPSALFFLDSEANIIELNNAGVSLTGWAREQLLNFYFPDLLEEGARESVLRMIQRSFNAKDVQVVDVKIKKRDNNYLHALGVIKSSGKEELKNKICSVSLVDITYQKMKEEVLRGSEARFENMANTAPVMIWISDVEGLFSFVNKVWLDYSGKELGQQLGMTWLKDVHPADLENFLEKYQNAINQRQPFSIEFRLLGKHGNFEWMMINGTPRFSREHIFIGFIGSCTSIKSQKDYEEKINKINSELLEINSTKDKFFSIISHDLRSPLSGLMGILDILSSSYDTLEEDEKLEIITEAASTSKSTYSLVENLLEWSRIQTGKMTIEPEEIRLLPLMHSIEKLYHQNLKNKQINFVINVHPAVTILADMKMTETILRNLLSNAIKFTNQGGTIAAMTETKEKEIIIKIVDNGIGMNEEDVEKLFKMDIGHTTKGTQKESGTGLGLIICKDLVEKQGGEIWVESKRERGSTFFISLPSNK
jgi:two-component system, sensor histidine kinase and response regulator